MVSSNGEPVISCVIPCKGAADLAGLLASLERQDIGAPYEVLVVDGWHDDAVAALATRYPHVRLVRSRENLRPGGARDLGVRNARAERILFIDADCIAEPGLLRAAKAALDGGAKLAGGAVLDALPWRPIAVTDNFLQFADFPGTRPEGPADYFPACNLAIRKADYLAVGGFPKRLAATEDTNFCFQVAARWPQGLRFVPAMRVRHLGRDSLRGFLQHQSTFGYWRAMASPKTTALHRRLGRYRVMAAPMIAMRLWYLTRRTAKCNPRGLVKMVLVSPLLLAGMAAFAGGYRRACLEIAAEAAGVRREPGAA